jgi:phytoene dehydrogenase-like protein
MSNYDIAVMGAGHNGLVAAAYMAKAGKKVIVLERKPHFGGGVSTRELMTPGYWNDEHSNVHIMIQGNPMLQDDELGLLSKFGLKYNYPELPHASIWEDGTTLRSWKDLDRTCEGIAEFSPRDAEAYRKFVETSISVLPMFMAGLYQPPFPMGAFMAMMDQTQEGRFLLDVMSRSALDVVDEYFESERLKLHIVRLVTENLQGPEELGTGMGAFLMPGIIHSYGVSQPVGGSGELSKALVKCIEHYGGEVRCEAEVSRVIVASGEAKGLELTSGETFMARDGVIGAIHPHVLQKFVAETPEPVAKRGKRVTLSPFSINLLHLNLKKRASLKVGPGFESVMTELMDFYTVRDMCMEFDKLKRGVVSPRLIAGGDISINDPTRVPEGCGVFYGVNFAPYDLHEGGSASWDEVKEQHAERALNEYRKYYNGLEDSNIVAKLVKSPLDHERCSPASFVKGDIHGCAPYFYQTVGHRPTPDLGSLRVPEIDGLYLVGPFMHPGGGVFGAGRATAIQMMDDLDMDYDKVLAGAVQ